jgi:hypothetical protein
MILKVLPDSNNKIIQASKQAYILKDVEDGQHARTF